MEIDTRTRKATIIVEIVEMASDKPCTMEAVVERFIFLFLFFCNHSYFNSFLVWPED